MNERQLPIERIEKEEEQAKDESIQLDIIGQCNYVGRSFGFNKRNLFFYFFFPVHHNRQLEKIFCFARFNDNNNDWTIHIFMWNTHTHGNHHH